MPSLRKAPILIVANVQALSQTAMQNDQANRKNVNKRSNGLEKQSGGRVRYQNKKNSKMQISEPRNAAPPCATDPGYFQNRAEPPNTASRGVGAGPRIIPVSPSHGGSLSPIADMLHRRLSGPGVRGWQDGAETLLVSSTALVG
jgi:hypothetical protein